MNEKNNGYVKKEGYNQGYNGYNKSKPAQNKPGNSEKPGTSDKLGTSEKPGTSDKPNHGNGDVIKIETRRNDKNNYGNSGGNSSGNHGGNNNFRKYPNNKDFFKNNFQKIKVEETLEDIISDNARIEKEIDLEIKEIISMRMGI